MSTIPYLVFQKCCACGTYLKNKHRFKNVRQVNENNIKAIREFFKNDLINIKDYICNRCRFQVNTNKSHLNNSTTSSPSTANNMITQPVQSNNITQNTNSLSTITNITMLPVQSNNINQNMVSNVLVDKKQNQITKKITKLPTASSTHKHCMICENTKCLHTVKPESILLAYSKHGIVIKHHSRCCDNHLDSDGLIKTDEFKNIPTTLKDYDEDMIIMLDMSIKSCKKIEHQLQNSSGIFDQFKDMAALDDSLCMKVTGWTKIEFVRFSKYIKCVRDTNGRTKEQLIAIYRYWLSKGTDQSSLAMFKSKTNQQQISHYLSQIRVAINKQFVPLFLGANKGKDFFLKHNTESVKVLHELDDVTLAIIADGTYTRLEKSLNNDFQYLSYSKQKLHNLVKPFIICCADGYFIDCYGPFQANCNDAKILRYVLRTDEDLKQLLTPQDKIAMFLDRGFRDNYWELVKVGFNVQIPTCDPKKKKRKPIKAKSKAIAEKEEEEEEKKRKKKPLTTAQAGETRRVTKVRFIIEKQNSMLKNKKSLDNVRNTQVGHIQIDYRIACAMCNFNMTPCTPDGKNSVQIANSIKKRCEKKQNKLESLLDMRFTSTLTSLKIETINDFPKLTINQLRNRIMFGSFKLRLCPSYLGQLIGYGVAYSMKSSHIEKYVKHSKVKEELKNSKIIAVRIPSRHQRGKKKDTKSNEDETRQEDTDEDTDEETGEETDKLGLDKSKSIDPQDFRTAYKVFIQYIPTNAIKASDHTKPYHLIKRYICNCFSGHQLAGCCIHIATVIYYLSYAKHQLAIDPESIKLPGTHLTSVLVDMHNSEASNAPRYVRHKRRKSSRIPKQDDLLSSSPSSSEVSSDDDEECNSQSQPQAAIKSEVKKDVKKTQTNSQKLQKKEPITKPLPTIQKRNRSASVKEEEKEHITKPLPAKQRRNRSASVKEEEKEHITKPLPAKQRRNRSASVKEEEKEHITKSLPTKQRRNRSASVKEEEKEHITKSLPTKQRRNRSASVEEEEKEHITKPLPAKQRRNRSASVKEAEKEHITKPLPAKQRRNRSASVKEEEKEHITKPLPAKQRRNRSASVKEEEKEHITKPLPAKQRRNRSASVKEEEKEKEEKKEEVELISKSKSSRKKPEINLAKELRTTESTLNQTETRTLPTKEKACKESSATVFQSVDDVFPTFKAHIPPWGGCFIIKGRTIEVTNTCTIDNYLFALWVLSKLMRNFNSLAELKQTTALKEIINNIDRYDWNNARKIWFTKIMKKNVRNAKTISFFGSVEDKFLKYLHHYQKHDLIQKCTSDCIYNGNTIISDKAALLHLAKTKNKGVEIVTDMTNKCPTCQTRITCEVRFHNNPIFLFMQTDSFLKIGDLPKTFEIDKKIYKLLCVILYRQDISYRFLK